MGYVSGTRLGSPFAGSMSHTAFFVQTPVSIFVKFPKHMGLFNGVSVVSVKAASMFWIQGKDTLNKFENPCSPNSISLILLAATIPSSHPDFKFKHSWRLKS